MSNVTTLAAIVGKGVAAANKRDRIMHGKIVGDQVLVNGRYYKPTWGGDFDVVDGDRADCVIDGNKCVVMRCAR